jgi:tRNA(Ile)-lysidine synthase
MQKGYEQLNEYLNRGPECQHLITDFHSDAQHAGNSIRGGRIRASRKNRARKIFMNRKTKNAKKTKSARLPDLARGVFAALQRLEVWRPGAKFGIAVSGGADSVALLLLFLELKEHAHARHSQLDEPIEIAVVHFNHQLRGVAADTDEKFVRELAETHGLEFYAGTADVRATAQRAKQNEEDAGRRARYTFFARLVAEGRVEWVATAHTMDDQAETVLAHLLRGTGLAGLGGIHPMTGAIVRPALEIRRAELRRYLKRCKQPWREDATNHDTSKTRARIRKKLVPLLEKHFQSETVAHLSTLAVHAREDEEFLDAAATAKLAAVLEDSPDALRVPIDDLVARATPAALGARMVRKIVRTCKERDGELGAQHVASVLHLAERGENGKSLLLPGGVEVRREKDALSFRAPSRHRKMPEHHAPSTQTARGAAIEYAHEIALDAAIPTISVPSLLCAFRFRKIDWLRERSETSNTGAVLDCSQLRSPLVLRNWRPGDRLQPAGRRSVHKLKRLLNEKGVSRWERNGWPVLTSGGVIIWARGFPVAAQFAASETTTAGLEIEEETL